MDNVLESITLINSLTTCYFKDKLRCEGEEYFLNGGCLDFCRIMKTVYPQGNIYIRYNHSHVCIEIDGILYDAGGQILDPESYSKATDFEIELLIEYSNNYFAFYNVGDYIINIINNGKKEDNVYSL